MFDLTASGDAACHLRFQEVPGFFVDLAVEARKDSAVKATTLPHFGLLDRVYETDTSPIDTTARSSKTTWERFTTYVEHLKANGPSSTKYKVLFITRHGLGYHNAFESKVGSEAWNNHWSHLDGDGTVIWLDSKLNADGIKQAEELGNFWSDTVAEEAMPLPGTIYTSPLARCLQTTRLVFAKVFQEQGVKFQPIIKELLRERLTNHTCDKRSSRSWIETNYPGYVIEPGFAEEDGLWTGGPWETSDQHAARKQKVLEEIFTTDENPFVALTTHSYAISAILRTLGLFEFRVREGSTIALFVKAEKPWSCRPKPGSWQFRNGTIEVVLTGDDGDEFWCHGTSSWGYEMQPKGSFDVIKDLLRL